MMKKYKITNSIYFVFTNLFMILIGMILNYMIPIKTSIEDYGFYRLFILYLPYFSLLHLGLIDGVYLSFKGKKIIENKNTIFSILKALILIRFITSILFVGAISVIVEENTLKYILIAAVVNSFILNISSLFNYISQATGEFGISNLVLIITKVSFLVSFIFLFYLNIVSLSTLIAINFLSSSITVLFIFLQLKKHFINVPIDWIEIKGYLLKGFFLMLSNVIISVILSLDKIIAKFYLPTLEFGYYVFASTIMLVIYQLATSLGSILFAYLDKETLNNKNNLHKLEGFLILLVACSLNFFYVNKLIIYAALPEYKISISYLNLLIPAIFLLVIIQVLHTTLFKIAGLNKSYTKITLTILFSELILIYGVFQFSYSAISLIVIFNLIIFLWYLCNLFVLKKLRVSVGFSVLNIVVIFLLFLVFLYSFSIQLLVGIMIYNSLITVFAIQYSYANKQTIKKIIRR